MHIPSNHGARGSMPRTFAPEVPDDRWDKPRKSAQSALDLAQELSLMTGNASYQRVLDAVDTIAHTASRACEKEANFLAEELKMYRSVANVYDRVPSTVSKQEWITKFFKLARVGAVCDTVSSRLLQDLGGPEAFGDGYASSHDQLRHVCCRVKTHAHLHDVSCGHEAKCCAAREAIAARASTTWTARKGIKANSGNLRNRDRASAEDDS